MMIIDDFIASYQPLKNHIKTCVFSDVVNPVDGVVYPFISVDIPDDVRSEVVGRVSEILGREPENITLFMRQSPKGVPVPHMAHTDNSMGKYSLMLYLNDFDGGGTAFLKHRESGICRAPESDEYVQKVVVDQNNIGAWAITDMCKMKENRACIFEADIFHCAMPIGGFGSGVDSRVVLTMFFS